MAPPKKPRKVVVDKATMAAMKATSKNDILDDNAETPVPTMDGIDHMAWPAEARKLALLRIDPAYLGATQEMLAEGCGYSLRSVVRYLNDPAFDAYCNKIADRTLKNELLTDIVAALRKGIRGGNSKHLELAMKSLGMLKEVRQTVSDVTINDKSTPVSDNDEIDRLRRELGLDDAVN
jgi:Helix-turn-helix of insertion element transposase